MRKQLKYFLGAVLAGTMLMCITPCADGKSTNNLASPLNETGKINCEDVQLCTAGEEFCLKGEAKCAYCDDYQHNCFKTTVVDNFYQGCASYCAGKKSKSDIEQLRIAGCDPPLPLENGNFSGSFAFQDKLKFECSDGYKMEGFPEITCGNFSQWSAPPPQCKVQECRPPFLKHGSIEGNSYTPGNQIIFHCNPEYALVGPEALTCNDDGEWNVTDAPKCIELPKVTSCPAPIPPMDGSMTYDNLVIGSKITISCDEGFKLIGSQSMVCLENGTWDWQFTPRCEPIGDEFPLLEIIFGVIGGTSIVGNFIICLWQCFKTERCKYDIFGTTSSEMSPNGQKMIKYTKTTGGAKDREIPTAPSEPVSNPTVLHDYTELNETSAKNKRTRKQQFESDHRQRAEGILPNADESVSSRTPLIPPGYNDHPQRPRSEPTDTHTDGGENESRRNSDAALIQTIQNETNINGLVNNVDQTKNRVTMNAAKIIVNLGPTQDPTNSNVGATSMNTAEHQDQPIGNTTDPIQETGKETPQQTHTKVCDLNSISNDNNSNKDDESLTEVTVEAEQNGPSKAAVGGRVFTQELLNPQHLTEIAVENGHKEPSEAAVRVHNCSKTLLAENGRPTGYSVVTVEDGHTKPSEAAVRGHNFSPKILNTSG